MPQEDQQSSLPALHGEDIDTVTLGNAQEGYREGAIAWVRY